jgi:hypothetical protein
MVQVQDSVVVTEAALGVRPVLPAGYGSGFEVGGRLAAAAWPSPCQALCTVRQHQ